MLRNSFLKLAGICGFVTLGLLILTLLTSVIAIVLNVITLMTSPSTNYTTPLALLIITSTLTILTALSGCVFYAGFMTLARSRRLQFLYIMSLIGLITFFIVSIIGVLGTILWSENTIIGLLSILVSSVVSILFGISILPLRREFGRLGTTAGVLEIVGGALSATIILAIVGIVVSLAGLFIESIILLKAAKGATTVKTARKKKAVRSK